MFKRHSVGCGIAEELVHLAIRIVRRAVGEVYHPHLDAVLVIVNGRHRVDLIIDRKGIHYCKIEIQAVLSDARLNSGICFIQINKQGRIHVLGVIPCRDRRIVLLIPAAFHQQAHRLIGHDSLRCSSGGIGGILGRQIAGIALAFGVEVFQFIVAVRIAGGLVLILCELPQHVVQVAADPLNRVAALFAGHKPAAAIQRIIFVVVVFPLACVDNNILPVMDFHGIGNTDLCGGVDLFVIRQHILRLLLDQIQPLESGFPSDIEALRIFVAVGQRRTVTG